MESFLKCAADKIQQLREHAKLYGNISLENGAMEVTSKTQAFLWRGDIKVSQVLVTARMQRALVRYIVFSFCL